MDFYNSNVIILGMNGFNSIVLLGCRQCGKSTHGRMLAKELSLPFYDTEDVIEQLSGISFKKYYRTKGFVGLLNDEAVACKKIAEKVGDSRVVVATTSYIVDNPVALQELRRFGKFVTLQLDIDYVVSQTESKIQVGANGKYINVPSYVAPSKPKNKNQIHELLVQHYQEIYQHYAAISDAVVEIKNASPEENFELLRKAI